MERGTSGERALGVTLLARSHDAHPQSPEARKLLEYLRTRASVGGRVEWEPARLAGAVGLTEDELRHGLSLLERAGALGVQRPFMGRSIRAIQRVPFGELGLNLARVREQERRSLLLLKRMTEYAYSRRCRRRFLLRYFGEEQETERCEHCDVCSGARLTAPAAPLARTRTRASGRTRSRAPAPAVTTLPGPHHEYAAAELRRWRRELAQDLEVPAYVIFNNKTLDALAAALPVDRESFLAVRGTGESRWEKFGPKVIEVSRDARERAQP